MKKQMFWTPVEMERLKELREKGVQVVKIAKMMGRTISSIQGKVQHERFIKFKFVPYTDAEKEYIRVNYKLTNESKKKLATELGRTFASVDRMTRLLGLQKWHCKYWLPEHDDYLKEVVGDLSVATIARRMNRGVNTVVRRIKFLHLHRKAKHGWYSSGEVAEILGCTSMTVRKNYIETGKLKAQPRYDCERNIMYEIREADLKNFIIRYSFELQGRNCDMVQIVDILSNGIKYTTGAERGRS